jgi:hypothetical protein
MVAIIICCACGLTTATILLMASLYFLLQSHFSGPTYFDAACRRHRGRSRQPGSHQAAGVRLSVIYRVRSRTLAVKDQLMCLASLIRRHLGADYPFEIVCVVSPAKPRLLRQVSALCQELPFVAPAARETAGIRWLLNGAAVSRGQMVVDAGFLASQIDFLATNRRAQFCVFGQTEAGRTVPILFSRAAAVMVFARLHWLTVGYAEEMVMLARHMRIQIINVKVKAGKEPPSVVERAIVGVVVEITKMMYARKIWSADVERKAEEVRDGQQ